MKLYPGISLKEDEAALLNLESLYQEGAYKALSMEAELLDLMDKDIIHTN